MEYVSYSLIILLIGLVCYSVMRPPAPSEEQQQRSGKRKKADERAEALRVKRVLQREMMRVPVPWGWPGHHHEDPSRKPTPANFEEVHGVSESLHQFVDRLFSEKHTVDSADYLLRKDASLRALLEDRYGRASTMKAVAYRKVKPPLLRDPSEPHDQMDNFPSGKVDRIMAGISKQGQSAVALKNTKSKRNTPTQLKELKTPWGW